MNRKGATTLSISIAAGDFQRLRLHLLDGGEDEEAAVLLAGVSQTEHSLKLLIREVLPVPDAAFVSKGRAGLTIHSDYLAPLVKRCRLEGWAFILAHSHPFSSSGVRFSGVDDYGERLLFPRIQARVPKMPLGAMVFGNESVDARLWMRGATDSRCVDRISIIGPRLEHLVPTGASPCLRPADGDNRYGRQVLALGAASRSTLHSLHVVVVGAGGLGSLVYQQLAHLGVGRVDTIDPDLMEESNLSRVVGSTPSDIGRPKVQVLSHLRRQVNPTMSGAGIRGDVTNAEVVGRLLDADVVFCCTDNLTSRLVLNRIAYQYYIPLIDLGVDVQLVPDNVSRVRAIGGRVMLVTPEGPCLGCLGVLDPVALAREAAGNERGGYIADQDEHAPSVISFNGVVASLAVGEFLNLVTRYAVRPEPVYHRYDGVRGVIRSYTLRAEQSCSVCAEIRGRGDGVMLPLRGLAVSA